MEQILFSRGRIGVIFFLMGLFCVSTMVDAEQINEPAIEGEYYETEVPLTLDLAERAQMGLRHFLAITRDDYNYEMPLTIPFDEGKPHLRMHGNSLAGCQPKAIEAMVFERLMTGSREQMDREEKMLKMMLSMFGEDGLYWVPGSPNKPWLNIPEPFAMVHGQGRMLRAMNAWYQYTKNPIWLERINSLIDGIDKIVEHKDGYAFFPVYGKYDREYLRSCYVKGGWGDKVEPTNEKFGEEGSLFNHQGHVPGGMATAYLLSGNDKALSLSGELVNFLVKPKLWADWEKGDYPDVIGAEHAHWQGHWHGHINVLRAILDYAVVTNNSRLKLFARDGYEWARQKKLGCIGFFDDQGCGTGRLLGLAVKLSYYGIGDYWEDVDQYIRNYGIEMQIVPEDLPYLRQLSDYDRDEKSEKILNASIGGFGCDRRKKAIWLCCSPHGNMGIFYAWDGALRYQDGIARINLLLNRASPWMDVDSYLPYEGKVVLKNKKAQEAYVRIPLWVADNTVHCFVNNKEIDAAWSGRYLHFKNLKVDDNLTIEFPMVERIEKWTVGPDPFSPKEIVYTCHFKGNTLIEISPPLHPSLFGRRKHFLANKAPMRKVTRFVTPVVLEW